MTGRPRASRACEIRARAGQASVELVVLLPLIAALAAGVWQLALTGQAAALAGSAARAGARAAAAGGDPAERGARGASARLVAADRAAALGGRAARGAPGGPFGDRWAAASSRRCDDRSVGCAVSGARRARGTGGQASVELVAALPVVLLVALAAAQLLAAGLCREYAAQSARAGAVALLQDADPRAAARGAVPSLPVRSVDVRVAGRSGERPGLTAGGDPRAGAAARGGVLG